MKKAILFGAVTGVILLFIGLMPVHAETIHNQLNAAIDAPNLIKLTDTLSLGVEGTKGIATNLFYSDFDGIEDDHNYQIFAKVTYTGSLLDFSKK